MHVSTPTDTSYNGSMNPSFTRRQLAIALAGAMPAAAQTPAAAKAPAGEPVAAAATELEKAVEQLRSNSKALSAHPVAMSTEPAFIFRP